MIKKFKQANRVVIQAHLVSLILLLVLIVLGRAVSASPAQSYYLNFLNQWQNELQLRTDVSDEERQLRTDFIFRLKFIVDRKYQGEPMPSFLLTEIKDLIFTDQMKINIAYSNNTDFLLNVRKLLENPPDLGLDPMVLIKDYVNYSGINNPIDPDLFNLDQNYTNQISFAQGQTMTLEQASDYYDFWLEKNEKPIKDYLNLNFNLTDEYINSTFNDIEKPLPYF